MGFYKKVFNNSIKAAGAMAKSFLMPPDGAFVKVGFQLYEALDLICEGPIFGLVDQQGRLLGKSDELFTDVPVSQNLESITTVTNKSFTASNTNGGTARVWFPIRTIVRNSAIKQIEIEFVASGLSGSTYTVELVTDTNSTTQTSAEKINVVNGVNTIVLTTNNASESKAILFEVSGNAELAVSDFTIRKFGRDLRAVKDFRREENIIGSSTKGIDKGIYFDDVPLRNEQNSSNIGKYAVSFKEGHQFQQPHPVEFGRKPQKLTVLGIPIKGPYQMGIAAVRNAPIDSIQLTNISKQQLEDAAREAEENKPKSIRPSRAGQNKPNGTLRGRMTATQARKARELAAAPKSLSLRIVTSDQQAINLVKRSEVRNGTEALVLRLSGLRGDESKKINFVDIADDEAGQEKEFIFTGSSDNGDGSITIEAVATLTFGSLGAFNSAFAAPDSFSLSGQNSGSSDFAGLLTMRTDSSISDAARDGTGSADVRTEGGQERDFVNWQNFVPIERRAKPYRYVNYDSNIDQLTVTCQVDALFDTKSFATEDENKSGRSRLGTQLPLTISLKVRVGKVDRNGSTTEENARFTSRGGASVTVGDTNGMISINGVMTQPYTVSLENIKLPKLDENDLYSFCTISKIEYETISNLIKRDIAVKTISEITDIEFRYPYAASIATSIDSRYYPQVPSRTFRAKGKKVLIPSNYTPIDASGVDRRFSSDGSTRGNVIYDGPWDGTFKFDWTDNPAWIYYDLLINTRYGLGSYLRDADIIDKWSLFEIGQYCDAVTVNDGSRRSAASGVGVFIGLDDGLGGLEPRFSCNILFKDQANAFDALNNLAKSFRAMSFYNNSTMSLRVDQPHFYTDFNRDEAYESSIAASGISEPPKELKFPPHLFFNNANVIDGEFQYADTDKVNRLSAIEVSFLDKASNYTQQTEYVENGELIKQFGVNVNQVNGIGCTSRSQAHRFAKYALFESANSVETVGFRAGFEALLLTPGDIIQINDELKDFTKSYGTILATSGQVMYFDPDNAATGRATVASGLGPKAILVQPALGSSQLERLGSGNIHVYNPIGKSGSEEFYKSESVSPDTRTGYRAIHESQIISLKLRTGGAGHTYHEVDDGVLFHIDVSGIYKAGGENTVLASQWFAESREGTRSRKHANFVSRSAYSIDVGGINNKYYRVLSVSENDEAGYDVSAIIHHTGKFKFVEENLNFDINPDTFQPDLKLTTVTKPNPPSGITSGARPTPNSDGSFNLPIEIHAATNGSNPADQYRVILEEPNLNRIESIVARDGDITTFLLSDQTKINQIGTYNINVFSEVLTPVPTRSLNATNISFTTNGEDFSLNTATDSFIEYKKIEMITDFSTNYDEVNDTGIGINSFKDNNPEINATINVDFQNMFGESGSDILDQVVEQRVDILNATGAVVQRNFRKLGKDRQFRIPNTGLETAFQVGSGQEGNLLTIPEGLTFQGGDFILTGALGEGGRADASTLGFMDKTGHFVQFETYNDATFYDKPPVVLVQQFVEGNYKNTNGLVTRQRPLGRVLVEKTGFLVANSNLHTTRYCYFASATGVFNIAGNLVQVGSGILNPNESSDYQTINFPQAFTEIPKVVVQLQNAAHTGDRSTAGVELLGHSAYATTTVKEVSANRFKFISTTETGATQQSGVFGYIATDTDIFNIANNSTFSINTLNLATARINEDSAPTYNLEDTPILTNTNAADTRFVNTQQMPFIQNTGQVHTGQHFVVHRVGTGNIIINHPMQTGMPGTSGFRTIDNSTGNKVQLEFIDGIGSAGGSKVMPTFSINSSDISICNSSNGNAFVGQSITSRFSIKIPDIRIKSLTVNNAGANLTAAVTVSISHPEFTTPSTSTVSTVNRGQLGIGSSDGGNPSFTVNISAGSVTSVTVSNSGSNRLRPSAAYFMQEFQDGLSEGWTVSVAGGGPSAVVGGPQVTGNFQLATMVNVPPEATNQMFILDNVFTGQLDDNNAQLLPNVNKSGFAFFLSGSDANPYLYLDGTDYKLSNTKINDGENHFIEAQVNRDNANGNGADEVKGYVDGNSGILHSFDQHPNVINYLFSGKMCLFSNSGRHGQGVGGNAPEGYAFNSGVIIDAIGMFTGNHPGGINTPGRGSLFKSNYLTGLGEFINRSATGTKSFMLTRFDGSTFTNALRSAGGVSNRGFTPKKFGTFEKTDLILKRNDKFDFDVIQIGNTGII